MVEQACAAKYRLPGIYLLPFFVLKTGMLHQHTCDISTQAVKVAVETNAETAFCYHKRPQADQDKTISALPSLGGRSVTRKHFLNCFSSRGSCATLEALFKAIQTPNA
jgi:hypothetical protein